MANYEESMFEDQDDLVERAVAWLCEASLDAGEDAGEWVETLGMVGDQLAALHCAAMFEVGGLGL